MSDELDYKDLSTDSVCFKQEERRVNSLLDSFSLDSSKLSLNVGWKGGIYGQMCGHYLHFDCFSSYKNTLEDNVSHLSSSKIEFTCPLCRQIANCVLPIANNKLMSNKNQKSQNQNKLECSTLLCSSLSNSPAKIWILSSLADKNNEPHSIEYSQRLESNHLSANYQEKILSLLKTRSHVNKDLVC
jgi:hypothetical protein